ncbi:hypothetical protein VFPPC_15525 [Pochonia chlamydosporia 170]|uniref:Uncharacterized protein n=1 Tax=Pochonia chlamydosporia 170 TaxID=1380566 RepID=A0A179FYA9_METCM|nr:hypothetical protein VFPPC_15525 [Pochonia chlamydosporia 170]OAQ70033.2 hypothetical protein VFPPC_15525 [Pochonia chlamydosporia 170]
MPTIEVQTVHNSGHDYRILCQSKKFKFDYNAHLRLSPCNSAVRIEVQKYTTKDPLFELVIRVYPRIRSAFVLPVGACTVYCDLRVDDKEVGDNVSWTLGPKTDIRYDGYDRSLIEKVKDWVGSLFKRETPDEPTCRRQFRWRATSKDSVSQAILEMSKSTDGHNDWKNVGNHEFNWDHGVCKIFLNEELEMQVAQAAGIWAVTALCQDRWPFDQVRQDAERIWKERWEKHREEESGRGMHRRREKERVLESEKKELEAPSFPSPKSNDTMGANNVDVSCAEDETFESR